MQSKRTLSFKGAERTALTNYADTRKCVRFGLHGSGCFSARRPRQSLSPREVERQETALSKRLQVLSPAPRRRRGLRIVRDGIFMLAHSMPSLIHSVAPAFPRKVLRLCGAPVASFILLANALAALPTFRGCWTAVRRTVAAFHMADSLRNAIKANAKFQRGRKYDIGKLCGLTKVRPLWIARKRLFLRETTEAVRYRKGRRAARNSASKEVTSPVIRAASQALYRL